LGSAASFVVLALSSITVGAGAFMSRGDVGLAISSAAITGMALVLDPSATYATSISLVDGRVYASDYAAPTPTVLQSAIADMRAALRNAASRRISLDEYYEPNTNVMQGSIGGHIFEWGVYSWVKDVSVSQNITLIGGPGDVFIMRVGSTLTVGAGMKILLS
ncbi:hypothetical protein T492DRAFT_562357, partial [Pavlovales sp. CCMP2436]